MILLGIRIRAAISQFSRCELNARCGWEKSDTVVRNIELRKQELNKLLIFFSTNPNSSPSVEAYLTRFSNRQLPFWWPWKGESY